MPDELFTRRYVGETPFRREPVHDYDPAGFTLADVRRLAIALRDYDDHGYLHEELAPFAALLKENKDG